MSRRISVVLCALVLASTTMVSAENAADRSCTREALSPAAGVARAELTALFARPDREAQVITTPNGVIAPMGPPEVLMARIGDDGKVVVVCVDSEEAARRFLDGPVPSPGKKDQ